jgi:hypothetical protein
MRSLHTGLEGRMRARMNSKDPIASARAVVRDLFPDAQWALLSGSVVTGHRTSGSDLDIIVVVPDADPRVPCRDSQHIRGWPVEMFLHDQETLTKQVAMARPRRQPDLIRMIATGVFLTDHDDGATKLQTECASILAAGPAPLADAERESLRYRLTDLLDDLTHVADPGERRVIGATAWITVAEKALMLGSRWPGDGKWLLRELRAFDADLAERWLAAEADPEATCRLLGDLLDQAGGPLFAGHLVTGTR